MPTEATAEPYLLPCPHMTIACADSDGGPWEMTLIQYLDLCSLPLYEGSEEAAIAELSVGESVSLGGGASPEYTITRTA